MILALLILTQTPTFDTRREPTYGDAAPALKKWLTRRQPKAKGTQHFCVVGYRYDDGALQSWVHWVEGRMLLLWPGSGDPDYAADALLFSNRQLSLDTDVVATEDDINGSTYLVTRAWVAERLADCTKAGAKYAISPRKK